MVFIIFTKVDIFTKKVKTMSSEELKKYISGYEGIFVSLQNADRRIYESIISCYVNCFKI